METEALLFSIGCDARGWTEVHAAETSAALLTPADAVVALSPTRHSVLLILDCLYARVAQLTYPRATTAMALTAHIPGNHR
ncbi:hypothetical protein ACFU51_05195 [Streptomyces sp. NPDC057430]|uniref:hypothetical protein n=1 Tax=Streptomyces sp. NPDC057430 TaxID=3346131 RepID=UPI003695A57C